MDDEDMTCISVNWYQGCGIATSDMVDAVLDIRTPLEDTLQLDVQSLSFSIYSAEYNDRPDNMENAQWTRSILPIWSA
jgi:hypothetical protein